MLFTLSVNITMWNYILRSDTGDFSVLHCHLVTFMRGCLHTDLSLFFYLLKLCEMPSAQPPPGFIINCMTSRGRSQRWPHLDEGTEFGRTALLPGAGFLLKYISNFNLILKYLAVEKVSIHYCYANIRSKFTEISSRWCNIFQSGIIYHSRRRQSNVMT